MLNKAAFLFAILVFLISISGCATQQKQTDLKTQGLRNQIFVLEAQLQAEEREIDNLRAALSKASAAQTKELRQSPPTIKQIQIALKNAGYNPGPVDGKTGKQTKDTIKAFQKANNLAVDGSVGKDTWQLLGKYLHQEAN